MKNKIKNKIKNIEKEEDKIVALEALQGYEGEDHIITSEEAWEDLEEERKKETTKFFSKISTLDKFLDGFREGDLVVISAPTKMGKTTLAQSFTLSFSEQDASCLWFSYELTTREFLEKFGEPIPYFTLPKSLKGNSLDWIEERIIESISKYGTKIVFIDHLHFLLDMSNLAMRGNASLIIGDIMRKLKGIALKWNLCIVLIAHTTKISFDKEPELSDIRDSSFISQEADTTLMIWRLKEKETGFYGDRACLSLVANRRTGKVGKIILQLKNNRFYEETDIYETGETHNK